MTQIDNITDQANQLTQVVLPDGSVLQITLVFRASTERWTIDVLHPTLAVDGINLCASPNVLREWRNLINFGLSCTSITGVDPVNVEDFVNGNAALYVLSEADVQLVEEEIYGGLLQ